MAAAKNIRNDGNKNQSDADRSDVAANMAKMLRANAAAAVNEGRPSLPSPSLTAAIHRYQGEWNLYLAQTLEVEDDRTVPHFYQQSADIVKNWDRAAESGIEAALALKIAIEAYEVGDTPLIPAMMKAALGWLDNPTSQRGIDGPHVGGAILEIKPENEPALANAVAMVRQFPAASNIGGFGWAGVYAALSAAMTVLDGVSCQPRGGSGRVGDPTSDYLMSISDFLMSERSRLMEAAAESGDGSRSDQDHTRLESILHHEIDEADLSYVQKLDLIKLVRGMAKGD